MTLGAGVRLGRFEILAPLGAGGMGEVYRALDTRLNRDVAIKVLPASLAQDGERIARFEREATTLAALNHPRIAQLFGVEEFDGQHALIMELVEGPDLSVIVARGPLPPTEVLAIVRQVADALEAAHEAGIVHRDLKPANIKLRPDGTVKVLDFGLAKAMDPAAGSSPDPSQSPTLTAQATQMGVIIGTAAYMSPEQARGHAVGKRADIWAFGVIGFELLTGRRLFEGETVSDTLAAVLRQDIDWRRLPATTPPGLVALLRRCLERDMKQRLRDIGDAAFDLIEAEREPKPDATVNVQSGIPGWLLGALAIVTVAALALAAWLFAARRPAPSPVHLSITLPEGQAIMSGPAISRDGRRVAFVSSDGVDRPQLYVRDFGEPRARQLAGTEEADLPFFSPDGRWIAYYAGNRLYKVSVDGGAPVSLAPSTSHAGGTWTDDGRIIFKTSWNGGLDVVPENGGDVKHLLTLSSPDVYAYTWPCALPGRHEVLFQSWGKRFETVRLDTRTMKRRVVASRSWGRLASAPSGQILEAVQGELLAQDMRSSSPAAAVTVLEGVDAGSLLGDARYDISQNGTLVYVSWQPPQRRLTFVDRQGQTSHLSAPPNEYRDVRVSPDGHRACVRAGGRVRIVDLDRGTVAPLAEELEQRTGSQSAPIWNSDGRAVTFASNHQGNWDVYSMSAVGTGEPADVLRLPLDQHPLSYAPDGSLLFSTTSPQTGSDLWLAPPHGTPRPWLATGAEEDDGRFSPNGRYVAYTSNASGRDEVYVQAVDDPSDRIQVSAESGVSPAWSRDGRTLFFRQSNVMMAATVAVTGGVSAGLPQRLFDGGWTLSWRYPFDVMPDGQHFLMIDQPRDAVPKEIEVVLGWDATLASKLRK